jgi:hypothetical protein
MYCAPFLYLPGYLEGLMMRLDSYIVNMVILRFAISYSRQRQGDLIAVSLAVITLIVAGITDETNFFLYSVTPIEVTLDVDFFSFFRNQGRRKIGCLNMAKTVLTCKGSGFFKEILLRLREFISRKSFDENRITECHILTRLPILIFDKTGSDKKITHGILISVSEVFGMSYGESERYFFGQGINAFSFAGNFYRVNKGYGKYVFPFRSRAGRNKKR